LALFEDRRVETKHATQSSRIGYPGTVPVRVLRTKSSTIIYDIEYDADAELLRVRLHRGGEPRRGFYEYSKVPAWLFDKLCEEEAGAESQGRGHLKGQKPYSVGTFYNRYIRPTFPEVYVRGTRRTAPSRAATEAPADPRPDEDDSVSDDDDAVAGPVSRMLH